MRRWSLPLDAPLSLTLAADSSSAEFDPENDQIWRLGAVDADPRGIELFTTYGLRANGMRILPAFELNGEFRSDPQEFVQPARVQVWLPSYVSLVFQPYPEYRVSAEYWIRSSTLAAGRFTFRSLSEEAVHSGLRLHSILQPGEGGMPMSAQVESGVSILGGRMEAIQPILFLQGGARSEPGAYPALTVRTTIGPGESHSWLWAHSGERSASLGFTRCRDLLDLNWDAQIARLLMEKGDFVDVYTGNIEWDAAIWAAQSQAEALFVRPNRRLKAAVPVRSRTEKDGGPAEQGTSTWTPANAWESHHVALQILPTSPGRVKGYLDSMLGLQEVNGHIPAVTDFKSPHKGWLHPPLLTQLALRYFERSEDLAFLTSAFPGLSSFYERWFDETHDRDGDGFPEWDHVNQAGFKSWPAFSPWFDWSSGLDISTAETVDLASLLIMEGRALLEIAAQIGNTDPVDWIQARIDVLQERLDQCRSSERVYQHQDYYLDETITGKRLGVRRGSFTLELNREFDPAVRVLLKVEGDRELVDGISVRIHSRGRRGPARTEEYKHADFDWFLDRGYLTSEKPSAGIEKIEVEGISRKVRTSVSIGDYSRVDLTMLYPLTAGVPTESQAEGLVDGVLMDPERFWRPGGIPGVPADDPDYAAETGRDAGTVDMLRNYWLGIGMLRYGRREEAADLMSRLLTSAANTLKHEHMFVARYDPENESILRSKANAGGLTPFALLLEILGIQLLTPKKMLIKPGNPFPNPVRLNWRGLQIICEAEATIVTFPDGGVVEITGDTEQVVEQVDGV